MTSIENVLSMSSNKNIDINKSCKIKKYIPIKEKFKILDDFEKIFKEHIDDYPGFESFIAYIFFNLKMIQIYTDIDIEFTYECFDKLQTNNLMNRILQEVGSDYNLFLNFVKMKNSI